MTDPRVVERIRQIAQERGESYRYLVGAYSTGIVESGLEDLEGGDADSYGFRQQRLSGYGRQNLDRQINNLFDEFHQFDKGQSIGELVADVQRPREDLRYKYGTRAVMSQAEKLAGGKGDLGGTPSKGGAAQQTNAPAAVAAPRPNPFSTIASLSSGQKGPYADTLNRGWDLLGKIWEQKYNQQPTATSLPAVTAAANSSPDPGGGGGGLGGLREAFYDPVGGWDNGQSIGAIGGHDTHMHFGGGPKTLARIVKLAQDSGRTVREYSPVDPVDPVHVKGSWHYKNGGKDAADISGSDMEGFFRDILRRARWK